MPRSTTIDSTQADSLVLDDYKDVVTEYFPIAPNQAIKRGHALAVLNNQLVFCDGSKTDGSEIIFAIATQDITVGSSATTGLVYTEGTFNPNQVIWKNSADNCSNIVHKINARKLGIYFKQVL